MRILSEQWSKFAKAFRIIYLGEESTGSEQP
jgi:hypothetical protein